MIVNDSFFNFNLYINFINLHIKNNVKEFEQYNNLNLNF